MANADHLVRLREGVESWNAWREREPATRPDLSGARLRGAPESRGSMDDAYDAWLDSINLEDANLAGVNLEDVSLRNAVLDSADLTGATLRGACLTGATLCGAKLIQANLQAVELIAADLTNCTLGDTLLIRVDLSRVDGLEKAVHRFASVVDISTLEKTKRGIVGGSSNQQELQARVQQFLVNCGVPKAYLTSLVTTE